MKIFYHCYAGAHSSVVASALHCGKLPAQRIPTLAEIMATPYFDQTAPEMIGTPYFMGTDEFGHEVYFVGTRRGGLLVKNAVYSFLDICGFAAAQVRFYDALHVINLSTKIGGGLSRRFGCVTLGRRLSAWGIRKCYPGFIELVSNIKQELADMQQAQT
ncbi:MAG TPA: DUF3189 family protein [Negativicutes bacterium]|nr:DUF3189 family protein [Negativicutes bacterium]